mgnify:CR=1 FL=1|tara:strand:- start:2100 stop:2504 length:405 start_codon:yes stop_codon:yes gene_type:complete
MKTIKTAKIQSSRLVTQNGRWDKRNKFVASIYAQAEEDAQAKAQCVKLRKESIWNRIAKGKPNKKTPQEVALIKKNAVKFCIWSLGHAGFSHKELITLFSSLADRELVNQKVQISKTTKKDKNFMVNHLTKLFS